ncbi:MAG TPA: hypothetical protein VGX25_00515 [Actinophytocola sp.]|uniref:hypothetical protein n=1 Tax=Actinophytocola sp. TaxID=1872138 RepID=UPI002DDCEE2A|nr:hypothetical protein [Actinophytocola sp.]HEV2777861.1 hypothetical protein [Actinophytocola sp.]
MDTSRSVLATVLVVLGCLLAGPAVAVYALDREITSQDRYVEAVTPLADDPAVRQAIITEVTDKISQRLGPGDRPLPDSVRGIVRSAVTNVVESDQFRPAWIAANRTAHPQVLAMLRGETTAGLRIEDDTVLLDLGNVVADVKARLVAEGVPLADQLPDVDATVPMFSRAAVRNAVPAFDAMETLSVALPAAVIALLVIGLLISPRRGRTLAVAGIGVALSVLLVQLLLFIGRSQLTARSRSPELAGKFYDALTDNLVTLLWVVLGVALVVAIAGLIISLVSRGSARQDRPARRPPTSTRRFGSARR